MSEIYKRIKQDIVVSMKEKNGEIVVLRSLDSAIQLSIINSKTSVITDDVVITVLEKSIKQRNESIDAFTKGNRDDLVQKEKSEVEILKRYLPKQLTEDEIATIIDDVIIETKASSIKDMGNVMKVVMTKTKGRFDSKKISSIIKQKLSS